MHTKTSLTAHNSFICKSQTGNKVSQSVVTETASHIMEFILSSLQEWNIDHTIGEDMKGNSEQKNVNLKRSHTVEFYPCIILDEWLL